MSTCMSLRAFALCLTLLSLPVAPASATRTEERWTINMRDADIEDFVEQIASISGQTLILDPRIKGQVSVISQAPLTLTEVYQLFLSVMATHGYSVLTEGDQARIVPNAEGQDGEQRQRQPDRPRRPGNPPAAGATNPSQRTDPVDSPAAAAIRPPGGGGLPPVR